MSSDRQARLEEILLAACERPPQERQAFLAEACEGDDELRRELEARLTHHEEEGRDATLTGSVTLESTTASGERILNYQLRQKIGEGGMGEVWEAEQLAPVRRRVALKVIKAGMDTKEVVARFESERQALALMSHPNIARVFDAGATALGKPYFAMECV